MTTDFIIEEDILLAPYSSIGTGGAARYFCRVNSLRDLKDALLFSQAKSIPFLVLGGGSNILLPDDGYNGLVIKMMMNHVDIQEDEKSVSFTVSAGYDWDQFVQLVIQKNLCGIECLSGIPGTVGATPIQNVGAYGQEVSRHISRVTCYNIEDQDVVVFENQECGFSYRQSRFKNRDKGKYIILDVTFAFDRNGSVTPAYKELSENLEKDFPTFSELPLMDQLSSCRATVLKLRKRKSMVLDQNDPHSRSLGSFFTNPILNQSELADFRTRCKASGIEKEVPVFESKEGYKVSAAWLIEQSGYKKGYRYEGVGLSAHHALAIVNYNGNTKEIIELSEKIKDAVMKKFEIKLCPEPIILSNQK